VPLHFCGLLLLNNFIVVQKAFTDEDKGHKSRRNTSNIHNKLLYYEVTFMIKFGTTKVQVM